MQRVLDRVHRSGLGGARLAEQKPQTLAGLGAAAGLVDFLDEFSADHAFAGNALVTVWNKAVVSGQPDPVTGAPRPCEIPEHLQAGRPTHWMGRGGRLDCRFVACLLYRMQFIRFGCGNVTELTSMR